MTYIFFFYSNKFPKLKFAALFDPKFFQTEQSQSVVSTQYLGRSDKKLSRFHNNVLTEKRNKAYFKSLNLVESDLKPRLVIKSGHYIVPSHLYRLT